MFWSFVTGLLGLALFSLSEGLLADKEARTKHLRVEWNCHYNVVWMWILYSNKLFHCTKLLLHIVNRSATIVCLGCFIKALKVSSSLYRDTKKTKKRIFFLQKHTRFTIHTQTHTQHVFILSLQGFVTVRTRNQVGFSKGDASIIFTEALFSM